MQSMSPIACTPCMVRLSVTLLAAKPLGLGGCPMFIQHACIVSLSLRQCHARYPFLLLGKSTLQKRVLMIAFAYMGWEDDDWRTCQIHRHCNFNCKASNSMLHSSYSFTLTYTCFQAKAIECEYEASESQVYQMYYSILHIILTTTKKKKFETKATEQHRS